jgi:hypothetical protein
VDGCGTERRNTHRNGTCRVNSTLGQPALAHQMHREKPAHFETTHIFGLTPTISFDHLSPRIGSLGSVTALDRLEKLDAHGQPRTFIADCKTSTVPMYVVHAFSFSFRVLIISTGMNLLSGSTRKGAITYRRGNARLSRAVSGIPFLP